MGQTIIDVHRQIGAAHKGAYSHPTHYFLNNYRFFCFMIALIWMSAGNSYFSEARIGKLLRFAGERFDTVFVLSPEKPAEHTFRAAGYSENQVRKRAIHDANLLKNRAERQLAKLENKTHFSFPDWHKVTRHSEYQKCYAEICELYDTHSQFRTDARMTTQKILLSKFKKLEHIEKAVDEAVLYLLEELAFIFVLPLIYKEKLVYLYHKPWQVYEQIIQGKYDGKKRENSFLLTGLE